VTQEHLVELYDAINLRITTLGTTWLALTGKADPEEPHGIWTDWKQYLDAVQALAPAFCSNPDDDTLPAYTWASLATAAFGAEDWPGADPPGCRTLAEVNGMHDALVLMIYPRTGIVADDQHYASMQFEWDWIALPPAGWGGEFRASVARNDWAHTPGSTDGYCYRARAHWSHTLHPWLAALSAGKLSMLLDYGVAKHDETFIAFPPVGLYTSMEPYGSATDYFWDALGSYVSICDITPPPGTGTTQVQVCSDITQMSEYLRMTITTDMAWPQGQHAFVTASGLIITVLTEGITWTPF